MLSLFEQAFPKQIDDDYFKVFKAERNLAELQVAIALILGLLREAYPNPYERYQYLEAELNSAVFTNLADQIVLIFVDEQDKIMAENPDLGELMQCQFRLKLKAAFLPAPER